MTLILKIDPINPEKELIIAAAKVIKEGGTVVFPTETVYGLGANGLDSEACKRIFEIKGRPRDNPLILHISGINSLYNLTVDTDRRLLDFAKKVWPGPITMLFKADPKVPRIVTAGLPTVAIRCPANKIALSLIEESGTPIAAPSANISTKPSTTRLKHILQDLDGKVDMIIDGGQTTFGVESTIIDMTTTPPRLLRPGALTVDEIEKHIGNIIVPKTINQKLIDNETAIAPGMKYKHYAPDKRLVLVSNKDLFAEAAVVAKERQEKIAILCSSQTAKDLRESTDLQNITLIILGNGDNLYEIASNLFDAFRTLDDTKAKLGFIQGFDERGIGLTIMNRILKATGNSVAKDPDDIADAIIM